MTTTPTTATPKDQRDAWLKLVTHLEAQLLVAKENAKALAKLGRVFNIQPTEDPRATAWAAQRLLDAIQGLPVPEVPVDHAEGQASILDLAGGPAPMGPEETPAWPSTSGDGPVEHRPRRLLDAGGDLWEELEDGCWGFCPPGSDPIIEGPYVEGPGSELWAGPLLLEELAREWGPLREPEGDEYDRGARDDE